MKNKLSVLLLLLIPIILAACNFPQNMEMGEVITDFAEQPLGNPSPVANENQEIQPENPFSESIDPTNLPPTPSAPQTTNPTPDPLTTLYGCEMTFQFASGPIEGKSTQFNVLDKDYFLEKGDKFAPGKGTSVYYEELPYLILHSGNLGGNILRPMEAEFLRKYLEYWGTNGNQYIQGQMDALIGSRVNWFCNGEPLFETEINGLVRLSHQASNRLWLEPRQLTQILLDKEGKTTEWIGSIDENVQSDLYIGFCGWGPNEIEENRFTYYRYVISFEILP